MALGVILVLIGILFLIDSLDLVDGVTLARFWPVVLIAIGLLIVYDRVRRGLRRR